VNKSGGGGVVVPGIGTPPGPDGDESDDDG
jgi:hypothetical protein